MNAASAVLFAVATELANQAKDSLPELREGEKVQREWFEDGIYKRLRWSTGFAYTRIAAFAAFICRSASL